jgi:hypothetical protein
VPCPDIISSHPWSIDFIYWWAVIKGAFIINWVERGTRNHIMQLAKWVFDKSIISDFDLDELVLIVQAIAKPRVIIKIGRSLMSIGRINVLFVSIIIQLIDLPAIMDIVPSIIVGIMISIFSLILISGLDRLGPHSTTKLNRIE